MTLILLLVACVAEHKQTVTTSIIEGGGTDTTFYAMVLQETYDQATYPYSNFEAPDSTLVSRTKTLLRCEIAKQGDIEETSCSPALTAKQAEDAMKGSVSFRPTVAPVKAPPASATAKESQ